MKILKTQKTAGHLQEKMIKNLIIKYLCVKSLDWAY